jgi:TPR repeat protein/S1-C subfamily serine protease
MKKFLILFIFLLASFQSFAQGWAGALQGLSKGLSDWAEIEMQKQMQLELMQKKIELEQERIKYQQEIEMRRQDAIKLEQQKNEEARQQQEKIRIRDERKIGYTGTGFFIDNTGYIITNAHVLDDMPDVYVRLNSKSPDFKAKIVKIDGRRDLALLRIETKSNGLKLKPILPEQKGDQVYAVGFPIPKLQGQESKITNGVVSSLSGMNGDTHWLQISAPIQGGNSGGPLVLSNGDVIGVVVATINSSRFQKIYGNTPQNINYAIKSDVVLEFLKESGVKNIASSISGKPLRYVDASTVMVIAKDENPPLFPEEIAAQKRQAIKLSSEAFSKYQEATRSVSTLDRQKIYKEALDLFYKSLSLDEAQPKVLGYLGYMYAVGLGVERDEVRAEGYYRKSAELGDFYAAANLGSFYMSGIVVAKDYNAARQWLEKGAVGGVPSAYMNLGLLYEQGYGVEKNISKAFEYYSQAANKDDAAGQAAVAVIHYLGWLGAVRYDLAHYWALKAAEKNSPIGLNVLGVLYENGLGGLTKNKEKAIEYYGRAAAAGNASAKNNLNRLGG